MNDTQRRIAALIAFFMLLSVSMFLIACTYGVASGGISGGSGLGWWYLSFMRNANEIRVVFAAPILIIASTITVLGSYSTHKALVVVNSIFAVFGVGAAFILYILLKDQDGFAQPLWYNSNPAISPEDVVSGSTIFLGYLAAWLSSQLIAQLGLPTKAGEATQSLLSSVRDWLRKPDAPRADPRAPEPGKESI